MGKEIETGWNTYHSSPKDIAANQEFCKSKNIAELIRLRDECLEAVKEYEAREDFHDWKIEKKPDGDYPIFLYEDALAKISFFCSVIRQKRDNMFNYCRWSPMRDTYHEATDSVYEYVKKNPRATYDEVVSQSGENSQMALDYLIEIGKIERDGSLDNNYWIIL